VSVPSICQVAMCTQDLPATINTYVTVFGFASSGGRMLWGERIALIQGLPTGADTTASLWWLVGSQDYMQLEFFTHTRPPQRPLSATWKPSDYGWVRWGVAVRDFDDVCSRLAEHGLNTLSEPRTSGGARRVCFREPGASVIVEIIESKEDSFRSDRRRFYDLSPAIHYVAVSVPDLAATRAVLMASGLREVPADTLHEAADEALWGLDGADRTVAVLTDGDVFIEIIQYLDPRPMEIDADRLLSDQGFMNIGLGFRDRSEYMHAINELLQQGCSMAYPPPDVSGGTYLRTPDGVSIELVITPRELESDFGFRPVPAAPYKLGWPTYSGSPG
jgi:catechol 2,3-dioxygenase-like lactoylglutathione lyase family enzyme